MNKGYLYIIENEGWIKIGKTISPKDRLRQYNSSFPEDKLSYYYLSELLYDCDVAEDILLESLECRSNTLRKRKEWFKSSNMNNGAGKKGLLSFIVNKIEEITDSYMD